MLVPCPQVKGNAAAFAAVVATGGIIQMVQGALRHVYPAQVLLLRLLLLLCHRRRHRVRPYPNPRRQIEACAPFNFSLIIWFGVGLYRHSLLRPKQCIMEAPE